MGNADGTQPIFDVGAAEGAGEADGSAESEAVQWVLQPRGGAKKGGRRHFMHSVREGIHLSGYESALGADTGELKRIFPGGVAKLWGSTPTSQTRNAKAVALRDRKVGDEVLFYAEKKFIARARILGLFRNRDLAAAVWGIDAEEQNTWEHIMALGDVVEFDVPAGPLLDALAITPPLRGLTLVSAALRSQHLGLLNRLLNGQSPAGGRLSSGAVPTATGKSLGRGDLLRTLGTLDVGVPDERQRRHEVLALLWAIGRLLSGRDRMASWGAFRSQLVPILHEFGALDDGLSAEYPFRNLCGSGLWEVVGAERGESDLAPTAASAEPEAARAGLRVEAATLLRQPLTRAEAIGLLCNTYLGDVDQYELLERVGLVGYAHAGGVEQEGERRSGRGRSTGRGGRRQATVLRPDRDQRLVERVKLLHLHQCQVCGLRLETRFSHYSEAAHIRGLGRPHDGPDEMANLLCLCPNHHVQFDTLAIFIDQQWNVRRSKDGASISSLRRHPEHAIGQEYVEYHRGLCGGSRFGMVSS
ncbi:HNH endonuclease [Streptomyces sp. SBT349]|uniref:HNH endonuclease n=1 Tax=Streptomyces sp. SBT349 TaxID=1580539 RepID=UPI001F268F5B|nr:HNH endonuclease [Streptomyces sp. SBT349]